MRKHLIALMALILTAALAASPAFAADSGADPLSLEELTAWVASIRELAAEGELYSDPHDPLYQTEDGYAFVYDFGTLFYDSPDLTADSVLLALVIYDDEVEGPRGTDTLTPLNNLLPRFYSENDQLLGTREQALIYHGEDLPDSVWWAAVSRDGQRVNTVQYTVHERLADGTYTDTGLLFTLQQNTVVAIRAYGLNQRITEAELLAQEEELAALAGAEDYAMVANATDGASLTPFAEEDLDCLGIRFLTCSPEDALDALGSPDADDIQSGMRVMSYTDCELVFLPDAQGAWRLTMLTITGDDAEGPRALRAGDSLAAATQRFRFGEGEVEGNVQRLYGEEGQDSWGIAEFGEDASATLRYGLTLADGEQVILRLSFEMLELQEITVYRTH